MASNNQAPAFVVMALILFAAANPLSHAQLLGSLGGLVPSLVNGVTGSVVPAVAGVVNGVTGSIVPAVGGVVNGVTGSVVPAVTGSVVPAVADVVNGVTGRVLPAVTGSVVPAVAGVVNGLTGSVVPVVTGLVKGVTGSVVPVVTGLVYGVTSSVVPPVTGLVNGVTGSVVPAVTGLVNGVTRSLSPPVSGLLSGLNVSGVVCCTANGNCPAGATGIAGVPVKINCTNLVGATVTVGQGTICANGGFNVSVPNVLSTLGGLLNPSLPIPCNAVVQLPLNQTICPILSSVNGTLSSALSTVKTSVPEWVDLSGV